VKEQLTKIKAGDKEVFVKVIQCEKDDCNELATAHLTQDDKFYCDKHGQEEVVSFFKAVAGSGGFV